MTDDQVRPTGEPAPAAWPAFAADPSIFARRPDGSVHYRGRSLTTLVGQHFEQVWGLLVDGTLAPALPPTEPFRLPVRTGDVRVDVQSALAQLTPVWSFRPLLDISAAQARDDLARASVLALSFVAQSARGQDLPAVPQSEVEAGRTAAERFLIRWRGEAHPDKAAALDALWITLAEDGLTPSTRVARLVASTGADVAACLSGAVAAVGGPLSGGASARSVAVVRAAHASGDARGAVRDALGDRRFLPGFEIGPLPGAPTPPGAEPPAGRAAGTDVRASLMHQVCAQLEVPLLDAAEAVERAAVAELGDRGQTAAASTTFWAAVLLDYATVAPRLFNAMFICGRTAGWSAHVLDVQRALHVPGAPAGRAS
ncbi:citrate/2-methylcitrate synthase [Georgenia faecalis]|uniref:citrate/2-methylcitrate synthase n=1 Tax=Georgenia faecalis TaxID=2483799 RepID=UPI000FD75D12|nr:citrate/2-methylcitrate synthase [Georgenia faecalis]